MKDFGGYLKKAAVCIWRKVKGQPSYLTANETAKASKPFSDGEIVKTCMVKAAELVQYTQISVRLLPA